MATYRIGKSDLFNNDDLKADALTLDRQINGLDDQPMDAVTQEWFDGWLKFRSEWKAFYSGTILGGFLGPAWNDGNRDQLIQFEERFVTWSQQYEEQTKTTLPGGVINPSQGSGDTFGTHLKDQLAPIVNPILAVADTYKGWVIAGLGLVALLYFREPILNGIKTLAGKAKS